MMLELMIFIGIGRRTQVSLVPKGMHASLPIIEVLDVLLAAALELILRSPIQGVARLRR